MELDSRILLEIASAVGILLVAGAFALRQIVRATAHLADEQREWINRQEQKLNDEIERNKALEADVAALRDQIHAAQIEISVLRETQQANVERIQRLTAERDALHDQVKRLTHEIVQRDERIAQLEKRVAELEKRSTGPLRKQT